MRAHKLNSLINKGRGKAALKIGLDYKIYRPSGAVDPMTAQVATIRAAFNNQDNAYKRPNMPNSPFWNGDFDGRITQVGDYLVARCPPADIKFILSQQSLLPIVCVDCNTSIRITRSAGHGSVGAGAYGGVCADNSVYVVGGGSGAGSYWPCSLLLSGGKDGKSELPGGTVNAGYRVMLPASIPVDIHTADTLTDDRGNRYTVQAAEKQDSGWRLNVVEAHV